MATTADYEGYETETCEHGTLVDTPCDGCDAWTAANEIILDCVTCGRTHEQCQSMPDTLLKGASRRAGHPVYAKQETCCWDCRHPVSWR